MAVIRIKRLKKYFGKTKAVNGISFEVKKGEIFGFLGPNGAGKTTAIRCMMDFLRPDVGSIKILGLDSHEDSEKLKSRIGFLPGEVNLYENWTGQDHIHLVEKLKGLGRVDGDLVSLLDFDPRQKAKNLSTGNKQKLGLILALMGQPELLILDEPTTGLDPLLQNSIHEVLQSEAEKGRTIFMSSHNLAEVEKICGRVCVIREGKIVAIESVSGIKKKRLYTIHVSFESEVPKEALAKDGVEITREFSGGLVLSVKGNIQPVLAKLGRYHIRDLEITHASLEEVFMEFYK